MTTSRDLHENEIAVALIAGQVASGSDAKKYGGSIDIALCVGTAERIIEEIIQRADNPESPPAPLPGGMIFVDEFSSQNNDGTGKQRGISATWNRGDEFGYEGDELTPEEANTLLGTIISAVEEWNDSFANGSFQIAHDREPGEDSSEDVHPR